MVADAVDSGWAALDRLRAAVRDGVPYDVAIVDQRMPEMEGIALARRIQEDELCGGLPIVMLSSLVSQEQASAAQALGIGAYLAKPVRAASLYSTLERVLGDELDLDVREPPIKRRPSFQGVEVLVAEDKPVNQEVARRMLMKLGCRVTVVDNGMAALRLVRETVVDLVLMDCHMPVLDGYGATRAIRALEQELGRMRVPIIAITAQATRGDRQRCLEVGMDDYLTKPYELQDLAHTLEKHLHSGALIDRVPFGGSDMDEPRLDLEVVAQLTESLGAEDPSRVPQLFGLLFEDLSESCAELRSAIDRGDPEGLAGDGPWPQVDQP